MRPSRLIAALALIGATTAGLAPAHRASAATGTTLTIMHFNDDYQLTPTGNLGGMQYLAGQVDAVRAQDPQAMLLFAGDLLSPSVESSLFGGQQMIAAMNLLKPTAATFGNHEFDHGDASLAASVTASHFPWVVSNVTVTATGKPFPGAVSTLLRVDHGVKVGILGILTPDTVNISRPGKDLTISSPIPAARKAIATLDAEGATVIVAITHEDMSDDVALAHAVPSIDLIVGGHDHVLWQAVAGHTLITKSQSDAHYLGVATLNIGANGHVTAALEQDQLIDPTSDTPDPAMATLVKGYEAKLSAQLNQVIGRTTVPLDARESVVRQKESALGDFIADTMRAATGADVAIINGGSIRTDAIHPAGTITRKDVQSILPFGDYVVQVRITGAALKAALENGVSQWSQVAGRFPQVSGVRFTWSKSRPVGSRVTAVTVGGRPLDLNKQYTLATNDYMLSGGDGYTMVASATVLVGTNGAPLLVTLIDQAIQQQKTIAPAIDGRIQQTA